MACSCEIRVLCLVMFWLASSYSAFASGPMLGSSCETQENCSDIANSTCINSTCACVQNFVPGNQNRSCLPVARDLGSRCNESVQCSTTLGSLVGCFENECSCVEDSVEVDEKCSEKKNIKEICKVKEECRANNTDCIDSICSCIKGYEAVGDLTECTPISDKDGDLSTSKVPKGEQKSNCAHGNCTKSETTKRADDINQLPKNTTKTRTGKPKGNGAGVNTVLSLACVLGTWIFHLLV
ncbi:prion-like-(Q/N-rich) domain-bearing protein 25 [Zootermopsis nevadensis]|uniref:EB domain-containing protein n=1 Tax=Zootermopsis nevadensis TaxID=136037 RepID=A0A067R3L6_ZOONE|nr:prion-like-(Q/N-rich) domain-bearing protein 25 [Zootermopsis nevadensis]KDR12459.1 hypothetical protein L798_13512 [Zootermopsis nevadensis]